MKRASIILSVFAILVCVLSSKAGAAPSEKRLALVIGNASYKAQPLITAVNDAALISQTLQLAGFDVTGARDLDQGLLRDAVRNFTNKVADAGAGAVVFVYFAGYAVQLAGENYLIPVGAEVSDATDIPALALSLSELMHALAALNPRSTFIVLDAGRPGPFVTAVQAGGLAWTEPEANMLIAFGTAPGTLARDKAGSYGAYARALAEMIGEGGLTPANLFDRVRLRVHDLTAGGEIPWDASKLETPFKFFERSPGTERHDAAARIAQFRLQPMRALGAQNAYMTALLRDTFDAYADFLADYWQDPMTKRVRALLAARRESITWKRSCQANEPAAYWSYLERYPGGPHAADARRLLTRKGATTAPPSKFARLDYEVPPPLPDELEYIERPTLILDDPSFGFENPPPTPANFLEPPPQEFLNLKPPIPSQGHALPVLNLPLLASAQVTHDAKAPSHGSGGRDEAWVMKPAIDVPNGPQKQADSSLASSLLPPKKAPSRANEESPANGDAMQFSIQGARSANQALAKASGDRAGQTEGTSTSRAPSAIPAWLIDVVTARTFKVALWPSMVGDGMPLSGPSMFASASAGLTFQTWRFGLPRSQRTARASLPPVRPASPLPQPARLPTQSSAIPISPSPATGSTLRSTPRSAALTSAAVGSPSKPTADRLEAASVAAPAKPRRKPPAVKPAPAASQVARDPHEPSEAAPSDQ